MKKLLLICLFVYSCAEKTEKQDSEPKKINTDFTTIFEKSEGLETATYQETIEYYQKLADVYSEISIQAIGETDSGKPLHIVTLCI